MSPLATEVLDASDGVLHELGEEEGPGGRRGRRSRGVEDHEVRHARTQGQTGRQTGRQTGIQAGRQADRERPTLAWTSTLMVSRFRLVLRTLRSSIRGRMLIPWRVAEDESV